MKKEKTRMNQSGTGGITAAESATGTNGGPAADLIITRARVWTGDRRQPEAEAVAILGERIVGVGSADEMARWQGRRTRVISAEGRLLLPGFNDAHVHFIDGGLQLDNVDLKGASSGADFVKRVEVQAEAAGPGDWLLGGGWDEQHWDPPQLPSRGWIDPATVGIPVLIHRCDLHTALANSAALHLAGVTSQTQDPPGGTIQRDENGEPTGILRDAAIQCVARKIPPLTRERRLRALKRAQEHAASLGVTSVQHMNPGWADVELYMELAERGELKTRVYAAQLETEWAERGRVGIRHAFGSSMVRIGALKGFADGSLGSATAFFFEPYADAPETRGLLTGEMQPRPAMLSRLLEADAAGMQLCLHAIGDRAVSMILDLMTEIVQHNGPRDRRFRIEHAQHIHPEDFARMAGLDVIASIQPYHAVDDGAWAERKVGPERLKTSYPCRSFLERNIRTAFGTDWYVAPLNPMLTLDAAVARTTLDGRNPGGWLPEQKITMAEAVSAYTLGSAHAEFQEGEKGTITPGKLADMVLLSDDIFSIEPGLLRNVTALLTLMGGRIVHSGIG